MSTPAIAFLVLVCLIGAVLVGSWLSAVLSERHFATGTHDTVKLALGLVATMAAKTTGCFFARDRSHNALIGSPPWRAPNRAPFAAGLESVRSRTDAHDVRA